MDKSIIGANKNPVNDSSKRRQRIIVLGKTRKEYPWDFVIRMGFAKSILSVFYIKEKPFFCFYLHRFINCNGFQPGLWPQTPPLRKPHTDATGHRPMARNSGTGLFLTPSVPAIIASVWEPRKGITSGWSRTSGSESWNKFDGIDICWLYIMSLY